ncbi:MAG: bifunctional folylpolyglutamate synthase/dihydrofolate synthase [Oscillospiraceae bacterium]|nr:bifunctional folylpolyglutamate synthase/dihydrofolate synthase [Oscillospiraceae bacterium]
MKKILDEIKQKAKSGIHPGLESINALCCELGNIQDTLKFIHVAGTNGKGSVCAFIENILTCSKIKTGCYTSPCVFEKNEQFRINAENCNDETFIKAARITLDAVDVLNSKGIFPSEFEIETAIAFQMFYLEKCEICIIECGMGGLSDATNIIKNPLVSVLTPISYDHSKFLGESLTEIALNKCGIIKENSIVLSAHQNPDASAVIDSVSNKMNANLKYIDNSKILIDSTKYNDMLMHFCYNNNEYESKMIGQHQMFNASLAIEVCQSLIAFGYNISTNNLKCGVRNAFNAGRFEIIRREPLVICDGAHNRHGAIALRDSLKFFFGDKKITLVMGVFKDKDYDGILKIMSKRSDTLIAIEPDNSRALSANTLKNAASKYFKKTFVTNVEDIAQNIANSNESFCIFGSLSYLKDFKDSFYKYNKIKECKNG